MTYRKRFILFLAMAKFKQAYFAHDLSKKLQIFTAVHNSMFRFSSEVTFSDLRADLNANILQILY